MNWLTEAAQPVLHTIVLALVSLIGTIIVAALVELRTKVLTWYASHTTANERVFIEKIAGEAFAYAESRYIKGNGEQKYSAALGYLIERLNQYGIKVDQSEFKGIIEKAVLDYNSKVKSVVAPESK